MAIARPAYVDVSEPIFEVRSITAKDIRESLAQGWSDFLEKRGDLIFIGIIYPLIGVVTAAVALGGSLLPLFFPLAAGISLLGPVAATGFYELARRREDGLECEWTHFLEVRKRPAWDRILAISTMLIAIFALWIAAAAALYASLMGDVPPTVSDFLREIFTTREGWTLIVVGNLVGFVFALAVFALSVVSLPMLVDRDVSARTAIQTSVRAVMRNKGMMIRWGVIVASLLVIGSLPMFIGLAVVLPVLGYATWHLYRHLVVR
ncbi:DUF2189 domain-containing protein [Sphingosinicella sp. BN140058]|nr:DUF2189 domain-containing protein [Sphingosinicella sp. BN140058]QAY79995.1 DUF2189 domain-containing protein [Sphingosinicella sp. BN140058]